MSADKKMKARRDAILRRLQSGEELTSSCLAKQFGVSRGTILKDMAALRRQGNPVQVSSRTQEGGMYVAVYELPKYRPKS